MRRRIEESVKPQNRQQNFKAAYTNEKDPIEETAVVEMATKAIYRLE